ncbi:hypothetical protein [Haliangium sp.]|uniref:hypothetical protein n=1 Tax=Haliangium sp. TaxID=2663208 RepID=UPI003D13F263
MAALTARFLVGLGVLLGLVAAVGPASADETADETADERERHLVVGAGGFAGLTGPAGYGPAAELELFPGVIDDRLGLGLRWRGFEGVAQGLVGAGLVFEAGATRPHISLELHADVGWLYGDLAALGEPGLRRIAAGGGVRTQLGLWGPVAVALGGDGYFVFEGARTRLALMPALTICAVY